VATVLIGIVIAGAIAFIATRGGPRRSHRPPPSAAGAPQPAAHPPPAREAFGANVNRLFDDRFGDHPYTAAQIDAALRSLHQTGATLARTDTLWDVTEPYPPVSAVHHYDWRFDDSIAASLAAHGLRWLPVLDYSPLWAKSNARLLHSPPASARDYAAFASAFATRYGRGGAFWRTHPRATPQPVTTYEIWNEPDNGVFWSPVPDARSYADLYLEARKRITAVDPSARVIVGGLTNVPGFVPKLLDTRPQLRGHIDGVAIHPYGVNPQAVIGRLRRARRTLRRLGLEEVPLYVTELGWVTHPVGARYWAPPERRPAYISEIVSMLGHVDCGIAAVLLYTWVTPERNVGDEEDWYGIHPPAGGGSADVSAFSAGLHSAGAPEPRSAVCAGT